VDAKWQNAYSFLAIKQFKQIPNWNNSNNILHKRQLYVIKQLKQKHVTKNAILVQADKGRKIVVINNNYSYIEKVRAFLAVKPFPKILLRNKKN
jgi:hypothetical protein